MTQQSKNAYLAGLVDTSGSFVIAPGGQEMQLEVIAPRAISKYLIQQFGGSKTENRWFWRHDFNQPSKKTEVLLLGVLPYLIAKHTEANKALQLVRKGTHA